MGGRRAPVRGARQVFLSFVPADWLTVADRRDLIVATMVALAASFTGHVLLFRQHIRTFSQLQAIARLHRRENSQRVELERVYRSLEVTARTDELTRVDAALYEAKTAGRNRIAVRNGPDRPPSRDAAGSTAGRAPRRVPLERSA